MPEGKQGQRMNGVAVSTTWSIFAQKHKSNLHFPISSQFCLHWKKPAKYQLGSTTRARLSLRVLSAPSISQTKPWSGTTCFSLSVSRVSRRKIPPSNSGGHHADKGGHAAIDLHVSTELFFLSFLPLRKGQSNKQKMGSSSFNSSEEKVFRTTCEPPSQARPERHKPLAFFCVRSPPDHWTCGIWREHTSSCSALNLF